MKGVKMKVLAILPVLVITLVLSVTANAQSTTWVPGTKYFIEETDASDLLERTYDWAYCSGIPRFGHRGEFPYETFRVFDCSFSLKTSRADLYCSDQRYAAVKATRYGYYRLKLIRRGDCF
jgi:hypothetical protein